MNLEVAKNNLYSKLVKANTRLNQINRSHLFFGNSQRASNIDLADDIGKREITNIKTINVANEVSFLCIGLEHIYALSTSGNEIYKIELNSNELKHTYSITAPSHAYFQNKYLYVSSSSEIIKIDTTNNSTVSSAIGFTPKALCIAGEYIWVIDNSSEDIYKINKNTLQTETIILNTGSTPTSICFDGTYIWVTNLNAAIQINPNTDTIEATITTYLSGVKQVISDGYLVRFIAQNYQLINYYNDPLGHHSSGLIGGIGDSCEQICFDGKYIYGNIKEAPTITKIKKVFISKDVNNAPTSNGVDYEALNYIATDCSNLWMARTGFAELLKISLDLL